MQKINCCTKLQNTKSGVAASLLGSLVFSMRRCIGPVVPAVLWEGARDVGKSLVEEGGGAAVDIGLGLRWSGVGSLGLKGLCEDVVVWVVGILPG